MTTEPIEELNSAYYESLGRMVVAFQALEEGITFALIRLTRPSITSEIDMPYVYALSELSFRSRLKLLRNFTEHVDADHFMYPGCPHAASRPEFFNELIRRIKLAATECESIEEKRNQFIHSVWRPSESDPDRTARRYKLRVQAKRTIFSNEEVPLSDLKDLISNMIEIEKSLTTYSGLFESVLIEKRESES